jgi:AraC-like DNA-binding protein
VAAVAAELGYSDQAHLVNDFRAAVGSTPGAYVRALRRLTGGT